jgi:hypothetical protein
MFLPQNQDPEETMPNNLQLYHKMRRQFCQWLPTERSTRIRNMALFVSGLYLSNQPHLSKIVRKWPLAGKLPSLTNRLWRFLIPAKFKGTYSNAKRDKLFYQIAFLARDVEKQLGLARAGTFPFFDHVYRLSDQKIYHPNVTVRTYKQWRIYKMSDHLPLWVEIYVDFGNAYLEKKMAKPGN